MNEHLDNWLAERTVILDQIRVASKISVDSHLWANAKINSYLVDSFIRDMVLQLESFVLHEKLPPQTISEDYYVNTPPIPATWWDHFKVAKLNRDKWYWRWLGKLKPPLFESKAKKVTLTVDLEHSVTYPEASRVPAQYGTPYRQVNVELHPLRVTDF